MNKILILSIVCLLAVVTVESQAQCVGCGVVEPQAITTQVVTVRQVVVRPRAFSLGCAFAAAAAYQQCASQSGFRARIRNRRQSR